MNFLKKNLTKYKLIYLENKAKLNTIGLLGGSIVLIDMLGLPVILSMGLVVIIGAVSIDLIKPKAKNNIK